MKRLLLTLIMMSLFSVACGRKLEPEEGCNFVQNGQLQRVSWKGALPIDIYIHESVPTQYYPAIQSAMADWENKLKRPVFRLVGVVEDGAATGEKDNRNVIYYSETWEADKPNEQARTTIFWLGDVIYEADVRINGSGSFTFFTGPTPVGGAIDMESLVVHELGHVLGLQHNDGVSSVMATTLGSATLRREPGPVDIESIRCEYN